MNINRDYLIINDVKKSNIKLDNGSIFFYITDKNTQNIFVNLVINVSNNDLIQKYANIENAEDYTLTMNIVKPSNTYEVVEGKLHDKEKAIFEFNLNENCCNEIGRYKCELLTKCNINDYEEITTSNELSYKVKSSVLNDLDEIVEAPEYPLVIQLFDKLSDINQYEEDRRASELARQLAEEQRQARFNALDTDMTDSIQAMDNKVVEVENRITTKEQAVDKLIVDTKADIDEYKVAKDQEINNAITVQDNKIDTAITSQNDRITVVENNVVAQNSRLDVLETKATTHEARITSTEAKNTEQDNRLDIAENRLANIGNDITNTMQPIIDEHTSRLDAIEAIDVSQNNRLDIIEAKNQQQDDRLLDIEKMNKRQDIDLKCLFTEAKNNMMNITEEGNSIYLQNSTEGHVFIDEIKGNTLVNCNKEPDKELILNGNINTSADNNITLTEGVDGGLVDVALEGNTLVNVSKTKDSTPITMAYTVENSGNHIALQGDVDGDCRPVITGNTLWIDNDTEEILTAFDETKNLRLQSTFEDNLVTQEMVDSGEEVADNLGKYRVEYKATGKNKFNKANMQVGKYQNGNISNGNFFIVNNPNYNITGLIKVTPGLTYTKQKLREGCYYDKDRNPIKDKIISKDTFTVPHDACYVIFNFPSVWDGSNSQLEEGTVATEYEPYKESTKTLYLNSPLLEGDTIEQYGNNIAHVHRYSKVVFDGSDDEYWEKEETRFSISISNVIPNRFSKAINNALFTTDSLVTDDQYDSYAIINGWGGINKLYLRDINKFTTLAELKQYLQQNPVTVVYELASPTYELIEQSNLTIPLYANGHLDFNTAVPVEKVEFKPFSEELTYLYANTQYTVQFVSDIAITADITLGGAELLAQSIVVGLNRISITTPETLVDNKLIINGVGANIREIVVTDTDREFSYFEGMKSVGQDDVNGHKIGITINNGNLWNGEFEIGSLNVNDGIENNNGTNRKRTPYIEIIPNKQCSFKINDFKQTSETNNYSINIHFYDSNKQAILNSQGKANYYYISNGNIFTFTTPTNAKYFRLRTEDNRTLTPLSLTLTYGTTVIAIQGKLNEKEIPLNEPLRAVGDVKDRYVLIDGKWYIERKCGKFILTDSLNYSLSNADKVPFIQCSTEMSMPINYITRDKLICNRLNTNDIYTTNNKVGICCLKDGTIRIRLTESDTLNSFKAWLNQGSTVIIYELSSPVYEPIDYNPLEVYSNITHITTNSTIPPNIIVKNHGFNCLLKPSTTYTISSNLGLNTVTTPESLTEDCLRFMDTDTSDVTTMRDVLVLEGDWTSKPNLIPANFDGIESAFEQEYDVEKGKYKVNIKVANEDKTKENNITFYINEPLRGVGDVKDKVFIQDGKVVVQRNCGIRAYEDGDFGTYPTDKVNTIYPLVEPVYEQVEYNDVKLFIESFKNTTLFYNSNVPVTSTVHYSYSVPIVNTVAQTASISDEQDQLIIDLATQVAVLEMMTM